MNWSNDNQRRAALEVARVLLGCAPGLSALPCPKRGMVRILYRGRAKEVAVDALKFCRWLMEAKPEIDVIEAALDKKLKQQKKQHDCN